MNQNDALEQTYIAADIAYYGNPNAETRKALSNATQAMIAEIERAIEAGEVHVVDHLVEVM